MTPRPVLPAGTMTRVYPARVGWLVPGSHRVDVIGYNATQFLIQAAYRIPARRLAPGDTAIVPRHAVSCGLIP